MAEKKQLKIWLLEHNSWDNTFDIEELDATETEKQYQYVHDKGNTRWERKGRINKSEMVDDVWVSGYDKYVGLSRNAVIERFISVHETEVRKLKLRIEAEEDILKEAKKLLEE